MTNFEQKMSCNFLQFGVQSEYYWENRILKNLEGKAVRCMSLEAIKQVTEAEQLSLQRKVEAEQAAKRTAVEAERAGQAKLASARAEAEAKVKQMMADAEKQAAVQAQNVQKETEQSCQQLKAEAKVKLDDAAALIVRRVVNV
jgi:V/A-type H+-transporting ATPase subunit G/H